MQQTDNFIYPAQKKKDATWSLSPQQVFEVGSSSAGELKTVKMDQR